MELHPMNLVTVVGEALVREPLLRIVRESGAHGWTIGFVEGAGAGGERRADIDLATNVRLEAVVPPEVAERVLARIQKELFPHYALVAWCGEVRVLRRDKF